MDQERISMHFTWEEMLRSETADRLGINNYPQDREIKNAIRELVKRLLQPLRLSYGEAIRVSSGYRCKELNKIVGGVASSQHIKGEAADIIVSDPIRLIQILLESRIPFD